MPAIRTSNDQPVVASPYDILARSVGDLMIHAMLCIEKEPNRNVTRNTRLESTHIRPPLDAGKCKCDAIGSAGLDDNDREKIKKYVDLRRQENESEELRLRALGLDWDPISQYRIHPPATPPTADYPLWRFSCVGYVLEAYRRARIDLLSTTLPLKQVADLKQLYPAAAARLDNAATRTALGIGDGDRWPVALVGYVLHSLARALEEIRGPDAHPYVPAEGDEYFPRQAGIPIAPPSSGGKLK